MFADGSLRVGEDDRGETIASPERTFADTSYRIRNVDGGEYLTLINAPLPILVTELVMLYLPFLPLGYRIISVFSLLNKTPPIDE